MQKRKNIVYLLKSQSIYEKNNYSANLDSVGSWCL